MRTIKSERARLGLTQQQLSEITGIPVRTIQNWEGGQRECPDYVESMVLDKLDRTFNQPDYKTILEEILEMVKGDLEYATNRDTKQYMENIIGEIEESLK